MLTSAIYSLGQPPTFVKVSTDPNYYLERDAYERCYNRYLLSQGGFSFEQGESSDWTEWDTAIATFEGDFSDWLDDAVEAQADGLPVPSPPSPPAPPSGVPWWVTAIKLGLMVIKIILLWIKKRKEGNTDTSELVHFLRQALMLESPTQQGTWIPILELLAHCPIEIISNRSGEFQDMVYSSGVLE